MSSDALVMWILFPAQSSNVSKGSRTHPKNEKFRYFSNLVRAVNRQPGLPRGMTRRASCDHIILEQILFSQNASSPFPYCILDAAQLRVKTTRSMHSTEKSTEIAQKNGIIIRRAEIAPRYSRAPKRA